MLLKRIFTTTAALGSFALVANAQTDSTKSIVVSGSVDAYYRFNEAPEQGYAPAGGFNSFTSFTRSKGVFELGMASVKVDATALSGKVGATVDIGYGHRAEEFSYNDYGTMLQYVKQAYITYAPSSFVKFTVGKFGTHVGYELLDAPANRNYSMSYMFTNGPFFHTGLKADFTLGKIGVMVGVANPVDRSTSSSSVKTLLGQISSTSSDKIKLYLNYWGYFGNKSASTEVAWDGAESVNQVDLVATGVITDKFNIGLNGTYQSRKKVYTQGKEAESKGWYGAALYLNYDPISALGITLRGEYIGDENLSNYGTKSLFETTLSFQYKVGPFMLIPEVRLDNGDDDVFTKKDGTMTGSTLSALIAAVYKF